MSRERVDSLEEEEVDLEGEDDTLRLFMGLLRRDKNERAAYLTHLARSVKLWLKRRNDDKTAEKLLSAHLPSTLRISLTCPFDDVREKLSEILKLAKDDGYDVPKSAYDGPSSFIPENDVPCPIGNPAVAPEIQTLHQDAFLFDGRLSHMIMVMSYHPQYLRCFIPALGFLMNNSGPLSLDVRNYIAILAASRHKCFYLVTLQEGEFRRNGGDPLWLQGVQYLPNKMLGLLHLNKMLCHQPWFVTPDKMKDLLQGTDSWSMAELVHAIVIMAFFHALAGFSLGCGLNPEIDTALGHVTGDSLVTPTSSNPALGCIGVSPTSDSELTTDSDLNSPAAISPPSRSVMEKRLQHYIETSGCSATSSNRLLDLIKVAESQDEEEEEEGEEKDREFAESLSSLGLEKRHFPVQTPDGILKYIDDKKFEHQDFTLTSAMTLRAREYSWEDHGFPFLGSVYPQMSELLDEKFNIAFELTYRTVGTEKEEMDTHRFRQATWYYIHSIKGIRHDDYHYRNVNIVLDRHYKTYIRMVACFPEQVTKFDFDDCMQGLDYSEKVHVNILVLEARLQAELIYALRALMTHMKSAG